MDKQGIQVAVYESFVCKFGHWDNFGHHPTIGLVEVQTSIVQKDQWSSKSTSLPNIRGSTGSIPRHMMGSQAVQRGISAYNHGVEFGRESGNPVWNPSGTQLGWCQWLRAGRRVRLESFGFSGSEVACQRQRGLSSIDFPAILPPGLMQKSVAWSRLDRLQFNSSILA